MALSRSEAQSFFYNLGVDLDNSGVLCFKCSFPLYYKSLKYECKNNHKYTYQEVVYAYSGYMFNLMTSVVDDELCGVQFSK